MKKRVHAVVSGEVQGVGYRYKVYHAAGRHAVSGYVKNMPDGRVEVVAEGEEEALKAFIEAVRIQDGFVMVTGVETNYSTATGEFEGFSIRR